MKLRPRVEPAPPKEIRHRLDGDTYAELELYAQMYQAEYGEEIPAPALASEILRQFLAGDRAFRRWKRQRANGASDATAASQGGASV